MDMFKIGLVGVAGILLALIFRNKNAEYATLISIVTSLIIFYYVAGKLSIIVEGIHTIEKYLNLDSAYITTILKMIGITYIAEFSSGLCKDAGYSSIASQIEIFGKLAVLALSMPVLLALLETIDGFLS